MVTPMQEPQEFEGEDGTVYVREGNRYRVVRPGQPAAPAAPSGQGFTIQPMETPADRRADEDRAYRRQRDTVSDSREERRLELAEQAAERAAQTAEDRNADPDKARRRLQNNERAYRILVQDIDRALELARGMNTGLPGSLQSRVPGTPGYDLDALTKTIKSNVGFDYLGSMREASPTGGALGNVSNIENELLQATSGNFDVGQGEAQLRANLERLRDVVERSYGQNLTYYEAQYGPWDGLRPGGETDEYGLPEYGIEGGREIVAPAAGASPAGPDAPTGPGSGPDSPVDISGLSASDLMALQPGQFIRFPDGRVEQLSGDPRVGAEGEQVAPGVFQERRASTPEEANANPFLQQMAFQRAALEQVPGGDEAMAAFVGMASGQGYGRVRATQRALADSDRENMSTQRNLGGIAGGAALTATPFGAPLRVTAGATRAGRAVNAAAGGSALGGAYGFGLGEGNALERAPGGAMGALGGAIAGPLAGPVANALNRTVIQPVASGLQAGARTLARPVVNALGDAAPAGLREAVAPDPLRSGMNRFADRSPQNVNALSSEAARFQAEEIAPTFADTINDGGRGTLRALATRQTPARQSAREFADGRAAGLQDRISTQARRTISADPRSPNQIRDEATRTARDAARPFYERAYEQPAPQSPQIDRLLATPAGRAAMGRARRIAANEGHNPDELRLFAMDDFDGFPTGGGQPSPVRADPQMADDVAALNAGSRVRVNAGRGKSLMQFIADSGGIRDEGGEMAAIGADRWHRDGAWRRKIFQPDGEPMEAMAQRALDAGYFPDRAAAVMNSADNMSVLGRDDILEAMRLEMAGRPRFAREASPDAAMRQERRGVLEERLMREGMDPRTVRPDEAARALQAADDFEGYAAAFERGSGPSPSGVDVVAGEGPTMRALDYVKRGLDDVLETYRDPTTQRLNLNTEGHGVESVRREFRQALTEANPDYREALARYSGPVRLRRAADLGERFMSMEADQFSAAMSRLGPEEQQVARAAARRAVERQAGTQGQAPGVAQRLSNGREQAARTEALTGNAAPVQRAMGAELRALRNAQGVSPAQGSPTSMNLQDAAGAVGVGRDIATGNVLGLAGRAMNAIRSRGFSDTEAEAIVTAAIDPAQTERLIGMLAERMSRREARNLARAIRFQLTTGPQSAQ